MTHSKSKKALFLLPAVFLVFFFFLFQGPELTITDTHTHIEGPAQLNSLLSANEMLGIDKTYLMASPKEVLAFSKQAKFSFYKENFETLLGLKRDNPGSFEVFCTLSPLSENMLKDVEDCHESGASGIKLYNGHSNYFRYFETPLDDPKMMEIYAFAELNQLPISFDLNINAHESALRNILNMYPDLYVSIPHLMISSVQLEKVESLLKIYPNLFTDISFSAPEFTAAGFRRLSEDSQKYTDFLESYSDQILFGSDMVLSSIGNDQLDYRKDLLTCYKKLLSKKSFKCSLVKNYYNALSAEAEVQLENCQLTGEELCNEKESEVVRQAEWLNQVKRMNGLNLGEETLKKVYSENAERFLKASR